MDKIKLTPFDATEMLATDSDQAEYLSEALATGEPRVVLNALNRIARVRGMSEVARSADMRRTTAYAALKDDANPTLETLMKLIDALGLSLRAETRSAAAG